MNKLNIEQKRLLDKVIKDNKAPKTIDLDLRLYKEIKKINNYGWIHHDINKYLEIKK